MWRARKTCGQGLPPGERTRRGDGARRAEHERACRRRHCALAHTYPRPTSVPSSSGKPSSCVVGWAAARRAGWVGFYWQLPVASWLPIAAAAARMLCGCPVRELRWPVQAAATPIESPLRPHARTCKWERVLAAPAPPGHSSGSPQPRHRQAGRPPVLGRRKGASRGPKWAVLLKRRPAPGPCARAAPPSSSSCWTRAGVMMHTAMQQWGGRASRQPSLTNLPCPASRFAGRAKSPTSWPPA